MRVVQLNCVKVKLLNTTLFQVIWIKNFNLSILRRNNRFTWSSKHIWASLFDIFKVIYVYAYMQIKLEMNLLIIQSNHVLF